MGFRGGGVGGGWELGPWGGYPCRSCPSLLLDVFVAALAGLIEPPGHDQAPPSHGGTLLRRGIRGRIVRSEPSGPLLSRDLRSEWHSGHVPGRRRPR